jgi:hypothetical protein
MTKLINLHHNLKHFVSHIEDDATALVVARALADCTPAHALMELVRNTGLDQSMAFIAYKKKMAFPAISLVIAEAEEIAYESANSI